MQAANGGIVVDGRGPEGVAQEIWFCMCQQIYHISCTVAHTRQFSFQKNPILLRRNNALIRRYIYNALI